MKVAVILTGFLYEYAKNYYQSITPNCELSYYIYKDLQHAGELYLTLEPDYDGFLVSGPVPRAAICQRVSSLSKPLVSFGSNPLCYYETFFQIQYNEKDFYLEHGYFDLMEWYSDNSNRPLYDFLKQGEFHDLIMEIYQNTSNYSLNQLCEMEEKIKEKHIRLWEEGRIQYSVTRFSNIMPELSRAGVKTYFVYPKYEILKEAITKLLQEISLKTMLQNQTAIAELNSQYSPSSHLRRKTGSFPPSDPNRKYLNDFADRTGFSLSYTRRLFTALADIDSEHITSQRLASALEITPRSANRLLKRLLESGIAEEISVEHLSNRGRPEKTYRIQK